jgi:tRNA dimethylallyltransferase
MAFASAAGSLFLKQSRRPLVVVVGGPTGVGKSELALRLAACINGELISCDSVQVFRGLDIGSNKTAPDTANREHLLDVVSWREEFTAADFYEQCVELIKQIHQRNRVPVVVGGTGFYMDWLLRGRPKAPPTDPEILAQIEAELATDNGCWQQSIARLRATDPEYAKVLLPNDYYRLKRALSVHRATGQPLSSFKRDGALGRGSFDFRCFFLTADREAVCRQIDARCETMLIRGLLNEAVQLHQQGLRRDCQAGRSIGYAQALELIDKLKGIDASPQQTEQLLLEFLSGFKAISRQYSRKQESWFAKRSEFKWIVRPLPLNAALSPDSMLISQVMQALAMEREEFDDPEGAVARLDAEAKALINPPSTDKRDKRAALMKEYKSAPCGLSPAQISQQLVFLEALKTQGPDPRHSVIPRTT